MLAREGEQEGNDDSNKKRGYKSPQAKMLGLAVVSVCLFAIVTVLVSLRSVGKISWVSF